ncbi:phospholipase D family protein [Actinomadura mexicana]|uniref:Phosphatidylserine/phosphatidylglycerophosphate/cardiolipin synthase n=1 Tax=Actinomadura mexicana TaxID=134959 RepID=A0A238V3L6_9ACTN|nr:phospholipase D family protein [Actinomadura mexicana]SNR29102.1 Phosphatidylserine/phosphatidylglycerophosphate/cardiolipin synthase [Actinomadura mexicana]
MNPSSKTQALIGKYLVRETDRAKWGDGEYAPQQNFLGDLSGNTVDHFVNGVAYFKALEEEIEALRTSTAKGRYLYLTAWWLGLAKLPAETEVQAFGEFGSTIVQQFPVLKDLARPVRVGKAYPPLTLPSGALLSRRLEELHKCGVDVRILAWVSPFAARYDVPGLGGIRIVNAQTLLSVAEMRSRFGEQGAGKVMVNLTAHPLGAVHCKLVVAGDQKSTRAFTGGIDPVMSRMDPAWHDLAVRVTGPAATAVHRFFQQMWAENLKLPAENFLVDRHPIESRLKTAAAVPDPPEPPRGDGTGAHVQVLRTVPQMRFSSSGPAWLYDKSSVVRALITAGAGFRKEPISFAPDGIFEFKVALQKAIGQAEKYIFIADQAFSSEEIMGWINARLLAKPDLKVILLYGGDPDDPPSGDMPEAVNGHLIPHVPQLLLDSRSGLQGLEIYGWTGTAVHCKVTIIDDVFCIVGSANAMRRSLYTDTELSVAVLDATDTGVVRRLRRDLWAKYCGMTLPPEMLLVGATQPGYDEILDLDDALSLWSAAWGGALPADVKLLPAIKGFQLPMPVTVPYSQQEHDRQDADSRMTF